MSACVDLLLSLKTIGLLNFLDNLWLCEYVLLFEVCVCLFQIMLLVMVVESGSGLPFDRDDEL